MIATAAWKAEQREHRDADEMQKKTIEFRNSANHLIDAWLAHLLPQNQHCVTRLILTIETPEEGHGSDGFSMEGETIEPVRLNWKA